MASLLKTMESFDFHPKLVKDFAVRTKTGAFVSIIAVVIATILFIGELQAFLSIRTAEFMEVDSIRGAKMRVNFDVTFPSLPCAALSLDAMDASGSHQLDILHDVFKKRLDPSGAAIGEDQKHEGRGTLKRTDELLKEKERAIAEGRPVDVEATRGCGDCYGAGTPGQCCNTCEEVRAVYRTKGWNFDMATVTQCTKEGFYGDVRAQLDAKEGCNVYGHVEVPKVAGNVHFAPAHGMQHAYAQTANLVAFTLSSFNISHRINALSFGTYYPGAKTPVNGLTRTLPSGSGMHQYFVKLVPVQFTPLGGPTLHSFQFSVTEHLRALDANALAMDAAGGHLPGVFFNYDLSPIRVRIEEQRHSVLHFLTRVCAIVGGVFTVMGVIDRLVEKSVAGVVATAKGRRKGGQGGLMD